MELKRILARDTRSATEQAIALYGPDVLVISNHQVGGQTELVVALDVPPEPAAAAAVQAPAPAPAPAPSPALAEASEATSPSSFQQSFMQAQQQAARASVAQAPAAALNHPAAASAPTGPGLPTAGVVAAFAAAPAAVPPHTQAADLAAQHAAQQAELQELQAQARELQRSREIVDLVRSEIAALRREFRLSQQAAAWQGGLKLHAALSPLAQALQDSPVPAALRALLLDALQDQSEPHQALAAWRAQLEHSLARPAQDMPTRGVQVLAGPSGGGKTLMCARLARHACSLHGSEALAMISYRDQRAGAWSQLQMLGSQLGVDCFRASDEEALRLLLSELSPRTLVLVDTPGVQLAERLTEIRAIAPAASVHAVVPADASSVTLRKVLLDSGACWHSVMLSKLDEAQAPWPLLQLFSDNDLKLSCASDGSRLSDLMNAFTLSQLIDLALAPLAQAAQVAPLVAPQVVPQVPPAAAPVKAQTASTAAAEGAPAKAKPRTRRSTPAKPSAKAAAAAAALA